MIDSLQIVNFKSIKNLDISCGRVNVFIGEPNAGKTNVLEALALFSSIDAKTKLSDLVRFKTLGELFWNSRVSDDVNISLKDRAITLKYAFASNLFELSSFGSGSSSSPLYLDASGHFQGKVPVHIPPHSPVKFYSYRPEVIPNNPQPGPLKSPFGDNLTSILLTNKDFRAWVNNLFLSKGFELYTRTVEREFEIFRRVEGETLVYSYQTISETLKRFIFLSAAIETNENTTILFDEPEAHTFPFYTKSIAERIALDDKNQYFLTTHNPYLLRSLVSKVPSNEIKIFVCWMTDFRTRLEEVPQTKLHHILDQDIFYNLEMFLNEDNRTGMQTG